MTYDALLARLEYLVGLCDVAVAVNLAGFGVEPSDERELRLGLEIGLALDHKQLRAPDSRQSQASNLAGGHLLDRSKAYLVGVECALDSVELWL